MRGSGDHIPVGCDWYARRDMRREIGRCRSGIASLGGRRDLVLIERIEMVAEGDWDIGRQGEIYVRWSLHDIAKFSVALQCNKKSCE